MKQPIELRRLRDFGQIINDSFTFLKDNFKPMMQPLLVICGFFIVLGTISSVFTYMNMSTFFNFSFKSTAFQSQEQSIQYIISAFITAFIAILTQSFIHLVTMCYISVYLQKNNETPTLFEVWDYFKFYFLRVLGSSIVIAILGGFAFLFCLVPGFYLLPILYLIIPIIVIENSSLGYAFNKSFRLIKGQWWTTFGVIFVFGVIIYVANLIASIPVSVITMGGKFLTLKSFKLPLVIIFSALSNLLLLVYALPTIAICMCYFSLNEEKEGTGLLNRIDRFGKGNDGPTLPKEEY